MIGKWYNNEPLTAIKDCPGTCTAKIHAPALAVTSCTSFQHPVNYSIPDPALLNEVVAPPLNHEGFFISTLLMPQEDETIDLITGFADTDDGCVGTLHYQACSLRSAIGGEQVRALFDLFFGSIGSESSFFANSASLFWLCSTCSPKLRRNASWKATC